MSHRTDRSNARFFLYLMVLIVFEVVFTWMQPHADASRSYGHDSEAGLVGFRYLAEARSWALGEEHAYLDAATTQPLITYPAYVLYKLYGVSIASSRALASLASITLLLVVAYLLRRRYGTGWALLGVTALAAHGGWHAVVRTSAPEPWAALWLVSVVALSARRDLGSWLVGVTVMVCGTLWLHPVVALATPALFVAGVQHYQRSRSKNGISFALFLGAIAMVLPLGRLLSQQNFDGTQWQWSALMERFLHFESRTGFFAAAPLTVAVALAGLFMLRTYATAGVAGTRALPRQFHLTAWVALGVLSVLPDVPFRVLSVLFPVFAILLVDTGHRMRSLGRSKIVRASRSELVTLAFCGVPTTAYIVSQLRVAMETSPLVATRWAVLGAGLFVIFGLVQPRRWVRLRRNTILPLCALLVLAVSVPRALALTSEQEQSLLHANRQIASLLLPTARICGEDVYALTADSHLSSTLIDPSALLDHASESGRLLDEIRRHGVTHVLAAHPRGMSPTVRRFVAGGAPLEPLEVFAVAGSSYHLYRIHVNESRRSAFEDALRAYRLGYVHQAEAWFGILTECYPKSGPAWTWLAEAHLAQRTPKLGLCHLARSISLRWEVLLVESTLAGIVHSLSQLHQDIAFECFNAALQADPLRVQARLGLARLFLEMGYTREAIHHLSAALEAEPQNASVQTLLAECIEGMASR